MSKYDLRKQTIELSGVTYEESLEAQSLEPSIYDRLGLEGVKALSTAFYERVFSDKQEQWFLGIFASSTKQEAIDNQYRFLVQTFGGPPLYRETKGKYTRLVGRHANYNISVKAARRWVEHMEETMLEQGLQDEIRLALSKYFRYTAHYIVVASTYMRPDQLSGGTSMDAGKIW